MTYVEVMVEEVRGWIREVATWDDFDAVDPEQVRETYSRLLQLPDSGLAVSRNEVIAVFEWHRRAMRTAVDALVGDRTG
jgi:hypothetical protein